MKKNYVNKLKKRFWNYVLPNNLIFNEAEKICASKTTLGYQSKILCKYRFEKLDRYLKNGNSLLKGPSIKILLLSITYFMKFNKNKMPKLLDFGGACGENIISLEKIFGSDIYKSSWVLETKAQVKEAKNWNFSRNINFVNNLEKLNDIYIDLFYSSCALNYLSNPYKVLSIVANKKVPLVCLTRNNFSKIPNAFVQISDLSDNGFGHHFNKYGNPLIWYPSQTLCENTIKEIFLSSNYELIFDETIVESGIIKNKDNYSKDIIFKLRN